MGNSRQARHILIEGQRSVAGFGDRTAARDRACERSFARSLERKRRTAGSDATQQVEVTGIRLDRGGPDHVDHGGDAVCTRDIADCPGATDSSSRDSDIFTNRRATQNLQLAASVHNRIIPSTSGTETIAVTDTHRTGVNHRCTRVGVVSSESHRPDSTFSEPQRTADSRFDPSAVQIQRSRRRDCAASHDTPAIHGKRTDCVVVGSHINDSAL